MIMLTDSMAYINCVCLTDLYHLYLNSPHGTAFIISLCVGVCVCVGVGIYTLRLGDQQTAEGP